MPNIVYKNMYFFSSEDSLSIVSSIIVQKSVQGHWHGYKGTFIPPGCPHYRKTELGSPVKPFPLDCFIEFRILG